MSCAGPRTSTPRNGGAASNTTRTHSGFAARGRSFTSPTAITISNAPSFQRNQTGDTSALPSRRYVVSTAGEAPSSSERTGSIQASVTNGVGSGGEQPPVPLGNDLDGAVDHLDRGLIV